MNQTEKQELRKKFDEETEQLELLPDESHVKKESTTSNKVIRCANWIKENYDIRFNVVTGETFIKYKKEPDDNFRFLDDREYWSLLRNVITRPEINIAENNLKALIYSKDGIVKDYHPFKNYLLNLPEWDGETDHIKDFLKSVMLKRESDRDYLVFGFKKWFVALVVSMFVDSIDRYFVNQTALILVSREQGRKKSTWLNGLLPKHLRERYYYEGSFNTKNKDHQIELARNIIINMEEMESFNKNDVDAMKGIITQVMIKERPSYGRANLILKRRASFCGSTNNIEFLRDETGSRRWFVVEIDYMNYDPDYNVDLLYSQALALFNKGFKYWFDIDEIRRLESENERFTRKTMEEELILFNYRPVEQEEIDKNDPSAMIQYLTATELANKLSNDYQRLNVNNSVVNNIGKALRKLGYIQTQRRVNDKTQRLWAVVQLLDKSTKPEKSDEDDANVI